VPTVHPSFEQAVEKSFENLRQTTDISGVTVGNIVGNGGISAYCNKGEQTPPEFHETSTEDTYFSTFPDKFSTEEFSSSAADPVEKSALYRRSRAIQKTIRPDGLFRVFIRFRS